MKCSSYVAVLYKPAKEDGGFKEKGTLCITGSTRLTLSIQVVGVCFTRRGGSGADIFKII